MQRVLLVIGAALAFGSLLCVRAGGGPEDIQSAAQDVADAACPIAMMHQYGCPIPTTTPPPGLQQDASQRCSAGPGNTGGGCHDEEDEEHERHRRFKEMHWPIGSVPVGVGFDTTTMSVRLPVFLPEGTWQHVFQMELLNQTFMTIDDYAGTLNPNNMQALVTGKVSSDLGSVYNTFFGSYSSMYRTTQVDVITRAQLSTTPTLLDRVQDAIAYLPEEYDAATYNLFIHYWGTHVVTAAAIGGACEQLVSVKSCFASGDASLLQNTAQLQLGVKTLQTQLPTGQSLNQEYMEHTTSESVHMYGGDVKYIEANQWPQRSKTIAQSPVLIKVEAMAPITQYVTDAKRQANLQQAIVAYQAAALQQQQQQIAAAKAARVFTVQAATTVIFNGVQASFGYRQHYCHGWWIFKHCGCRGETACFNPGNCGTGCGGGVSATAIVGDMPTTTLHMGEQATLTPNGQQSCMCSAYPNYETPTWPFNDLTQSVTCSIDANGNVVASNVQIPNANIRRISGSVSQQDGSPVGTGCSIATATYSGLQWTETGGNAGCGASTGTLSMSGSITAQGWCCIGTTLTAVWNPGQEGCFGQLQSESCPGFND